MTNEEAIIIMRNEQPHCGEKKKFTEEARYEAYDMAVEALKKRMGYTRFVDCNKEEDFPTMFDAGVVCKDDDSFIVGYAMMGAEETFSIGQPVYDVDKNLMGYLSIGVYSNLNYSADMRIPVEKWVISLPTKYCNDGKRVYTYWQTFHEERSEKA